MPSYLTVRYREGDSRTYTYSFDPEAETQPKPGDLVSVDARGRTLSATVVEVGVPAPTTFQAKPILALHGPVGSAAEAEPGDPGDEIPY